MNERQLDWRTLLREPSLFDTLLGQNDYLDEFVRVHQTIAWPKHLDERPTLVQRYSWALPTDDALDVIAVHFVGGVLGSLLVGFFGDEAINSIGADGLFYGGGFDHDGGQQGCAHATRS